MSVSSGSRRVVGLLDDVMLLALVGLIIPLAILVIGAPLGLLAWLLAGIVQG